MQPLLVVGLELLGELDLLAQDAVDAVVHGLVLARLGAAVLPVAGGALATVVPDADRQWSYLFTHFSWAYIRKARECVNIFGPQASEP